MNHSVRVVSVQWNMAVPILKGPVGFGNLTTGTVAGSITEKVQIMDITTVAVFLRFSVPDQGEESKK